MTQTRVPDYPGKARPGDWVTIRLSGRFAVFAPTGEPITPTAAKEQALLALLATSKTGERGRAWLQDKLWSDRAPQQAGSSLRHALSSLRRRLGEWQHIFETDHTSARLRLDLVDVFDLAADGEFLEGIDARDPEFEAWLALERSKRHQSIVLPMVSERLAARRSVSLIANGAGNERLSLIESFLADSVAHTLRESLNVEVFSKPPKEPSKDALVARLQAFQLNEESVALRVCAENTATSRILWSGNITLRSDQAITHDNVDILTLGNQLVNAMADHLLVDAHHDHDRRDATSLGLSALKSLFTMNEDRVLDADQNLQEAYALDQRAIFLSWRAQLRGIQLVERHAIDAAELIKTGLDLADMALRADPCNSMVLATVSNARLILDRDFSGAAHLSQQSIEANPSNPLAWWARSAASLYAQEAEDAYKFAVRGHQLAAGSPYRFWWDLQLALSAAVTGRIEEAISVAERCSALAPDFRPPLRYLIALYTTSGDYDQASRKVQRLVELEPDFSLERLAYDPQYPVSLMRRTELVNPESLMKLS